MLGRFMTSPQIHPPVLFLVFNRPEPTQKVFEMIRKASPRRLYIAADGPRQDVSTDLESCEKVRNVVGQVDWPCEVETLFRDKNLGCGRAVSSAIDWFFDKETEGIILEDDCLPAASFFGYCQELLEYFRDEMRVMHISGYNPLPQQDPHSESYYFSRYPGVWGWATWRRAWKSYDFSMQRLSEFCADTENDYGYNLPDERTARIKVFKETQAGKIDTWDYQWAFALRFNGGLCARPFVSMISNLGLGEEATHTKSAKAFTGNNESREINLPLVHPKLIQPNKAKDIELFEKIISRPSPFLFIKGLLSALPKFGRGKT